MGNGIRKIAFQDDAVDNGLDPAPDTTQHTAFGATPRGPGDRIDGDATEHAGSMDNNPMLDGSPCSSNKRNQHLAIVTLLNSNHPIGFAYSPSNLVSFYFGILEVLAGHLRISTCVHQDQKGWRLKVLTYLGVICLFFFVG